MRKLGKARELFAGLLLLMFCSCQRKETRHDTFELFTKNPQNWSEVKKGSFLINKNMRSDGDFDTLKLPYNTVDNYAIFQGDIILGDTMQFSFLKQNYQIETFVATQSIWTGNRIPYTFGSNIDDGAKSVIHAAMSEWESKLGFLRFTEKADDDINYVEFIGGDGYGSFIGMKMFKQQLMVNTVPNKGNVMHEIGHCLGLWHEHCRPDRDNYIQIIDQNIDPNFKCQFIQPISNVSTLNSTYDLNSIMHYPLNGCGLHGKQTIKVIRNPTGQPYNIGNRDSLSKGDIEGVITLYTTFQNSKLTKSAVPHIITECTRD